MSTILGSSQPASSPDRSASQSGQAKGQASGSVASAFAMGCRSVTAKRLAQASHVTSEASSHEEGATPDARAAMSAVSCPTFCRPSSNT